MKRSLRPINVASTLNAWNGVVRVGFSSSKDCGFNAPNLGLGYQPEHIQEQVHSGRKGR
jgi:hypothetical protein